MQATPPRQGKDTITVDNQESTVVENYFEPNVSDFSFKYHIIEVI